MSVEFGRAWADRGRDATIEYIAGRPFVPQGGAWERAAAGMARRRSDDEGALRSRDRDRLPRARPAGARGRHQRPQDIVAIGEQLPDPNTIGDVDRRASVTRALAYMNLTPGQALEGVPIDYAFIGSCTNSRLSDLEAAAAVLDGRKVRAGVTALVVPGSMSVKAAAEARGLDKVFRDAGFEWRNSGCSMCVTSNGDIVAPGKR